MIKLACGAATPTNGRQKSVQCSPAEASRAGIVGWRTGGDMAFKEPHLILRDGTPVLIRQLVPEDAALYPDFLSDVTPEDLRTRFFGPMRKVSHELVDKLIHYDPAR